MRSTFAIQRSQVVHPVNRIAKEKRQERVLKANQFMTSGREGQRKRKRPDGLEEHETLGSKKIRAEVVGAHRTSEILKNSFETNDRAKDITKVEKDEIRRTLFQRSNQFETKRIDMKLELFDNKRTTPKPINAVQRQSANMDMTSLMKGLIPYSKVKINNQKENIINELRHRFIVGFNPEWENLGIQKLISILKSKEEERTGKKDETGFKPLHLALDSWAVKFGTRKRS
jgi:hypothetical protein